MAISKIDVLVEEGTSGIWTYRKWKSGKVEAWCTYTWPSASWSVWVSPIRYMDKSITIPSGIFDNAPNVVATSRSSQYWVTNCTAVSPTSANMRLATVASSALATSVNIYAWTD